MTWSQVRLAEVAEVIGGSTPKTGIATYWGGDIPWATPADLSKLEGQYLSDTPRKLTADGLASTAAKLLPAGSVLFSSRAPIGHVAITGVPMATNQGFKSLVPNHELVEAKFLYWWLKSNKEYLQGLGVGATFKEVSKAIVSDVRIPLPPLPEQRRIASILDQADALRAKRRSSLALLVDLADGALARVAASSSQFVALGDVATIEASLVDPRDPHFAQLPLVAPDNIESNTGRIVNVRTTAEISPISGKYLFEEVDVLYSKIRPALNKVALPTFRGLCSADMYPIRVMENKITRAFLWATLRSPRFLAYAFRHGNRAQMPKLNREQLFGYEFMLPSIDQQNAYGRELQSVLSSELLRRSHLLQLDELFASLQHRAFAGEL